MICSRISGKSEIDGSFGIGDVPKQERTKISHQPYFHDNNITITLLYCPIKYPTT